MSSISSKSTIFTFFFITILFAPSIARKPHIITVRSPNLFPESFKWDRSGQHFIVGSYRHGTVHSVSDAGVVQTLISDPQLPPNVSIGGVAIDSVHNRLLAAVHSSAPFPAFDALAAYDLRSRRRLFLAPLSDPLTSDRQIANDVAVDFKGNAFVTNSAGNFIWKVNVEGEPSIFSRSRIFTSQHVYSDLPGSFCGLNGITYISKGYLLVVQSNTGKVFKVDSDDGTARLVLLSKDLTGADGIAVRSDGVVVVVSHHTAWFLKSDDSWGEAVVYDKIALEVEKFPTGVAFREGNKAYVLYGHMDEGMLGNVDRMEFSIEEIESEREKEGESVWIFVLIGLGLAYLMYWRFQMGQLVKSMNKKSN
eukprot:TRINITY_DN1366_c0_g1_i1.p1 TRINITY_DN1366_c0_g1~~TRINITY_DN1366_c0_g1_i1.p1  ORF type:complete len:364 (+),score=26.64 TRINITY_DN1366_c0_g1_i1:101-1192(+)